MINKLTRHWHMVLIISFATWLRVWPLSPSEWWQWPMMAALLNVGLIVAAYEITVLTLAESMAIAVSLLLAVWPLLIVQPVVGVALLISWSFFYVTSRSAQNQPKTSSHTDNLLIPVSVIILTDRADDIFKRCLAATQWAQEVIIIDYQSGNDWKALHSQFRFRVITAHQPITDFAAARNQAARHATQDWLFFVDSDEVIGAFEPQDLLQLLSNDNIAGLRIIRTDVLHGQALRWGEAGRVSIIRLGRRGAFRYRRPVHEQAVIKGHVDTSPLILWHYSHTSLSEFFSSVSRYAEREAEYRHRQGLRGQWWQVCLYPGGKLIYNLIFKLGILDGWRGIVYALMMSCHSAAVRVYSYELDTKSQAHHV